MLSRVAGNLYWIGRYVERAENVARLLDVAYHLDLDAAALREPAGTESRLDTTLAILACRDAFLKIHTTATRDRLAVLDFLTFDLSGTHSIRAMLSHARENARASREALSGDAWNQLNGLYLKLRTRKARAELAQSPLRFLDRLKRGCILFGGLIESTLPRTEAYHFLQLGRHLERVNQIGRIIQLSLPPLPQDDSATHALGTVHWTNLLRSCSAYEAYLREASDEVDPVGVVEFMVLNNTFPRAIRYCIEKCGESLQVLGEGDLDSYAGEAQRQLGRLESELRYLDIAEILKHGPQSFLVDLLASCNRVGAEVHHAYFFA